MQVNQWAQELCAFLSQQPEVLGVRLYGSVASGSTDEYSDVDIEIDVYGQDNSLFALQLPALMARRYPVIFHDFAPSLAPDKYVVTFALRADAPFALVDIACTATPHCGSISRQELSAHNDPFAHLLKLFTANLKHYLRGADCFDDILRMYLRTSAEPPRAPSALAMLRAVYCSRHASPPSLPESALPLCRRAPSLRTINFG